jgi:hypothetical protein
MTELSIIILRFISLIINPFSLLRATMPCCLKQRIGLAVNDPNTDLLDLTFLLTDMITQCAPGEIGKTGTDKQ